MSSLRLHLGVAVGHGGTSISSNQYPICYRPCEPGAAACVLQCMLGAAALGKYFGDKFNTLADQAEVLSTFKTDFFETAFAERSKKHLPDPLKGSAAKRMCMYFRWMVRKDQKN